jgi:hypothetical protein
VVADWLDLDRPCSCAARRSGIRSRRCHSATTTNALSIGFGRGFEVSAGIMLIALIVTIAAVRGKREDLAGAHTTQANPAKDETSAEMLETG